MCSSMLCNSVWISLWNVRTHEALPSDVSFQTSESCTPMWCTLMGVPCPMVLQKGSTPLHSSGTQHFTAAPTLQLWHWAHLVATLHDSAKWHNVTSYAVRYSQYATQTCWCIPMFDRANMIHQTRNQAIRQMTRIIRMWKVSHVWMAKSPS